MSRFGNPAFRDVVAEINQSSSGWLRDMIIAQLPAQQLPLLPHTGRQRLVVSDQAVHGEPNGHSHAHKHETDVHHSQPQPQTHSHMPKNLPAKVVDSLKARGEWPSEHSTHTADTHSSQHTDGGHQQTATEPASVAGELSDSERVERVVSCIALYFNASFGDRQRIDYGTGHELNFVCFLYTLTAIRFVPVVDGDDANSNEYYTALALVVFPRYLAIMRRLQSAYLLEPAGSRGVWGLDDYCFLPFLLGSSQLIDHPHIRPRSVRYPEVLEQYSIDYLYCDAVRWVLGVKSVSFAEHSPMLNDITAVRGGWLRVNTGLYRMYEQEVLRKYPIVQHFVFTDLLSPRLVRPLERVEVKAPDLCCSDAIHFPSALAGQR